MRLKKRYVALAILVLLFAGGAAAVWWYDETRTFGSPPPTDNNGPVAGWPVYGADAAGTRYSPLTQINKGNVRWLEEAWVYRTGEDYSGTPFAGQAAYEATPVLWNGTLYLTTPSTRVIALDAETGEERWVFDPEIDASTRRPEMTSRGVTLWVNPDHESEARIIVPTRDARLIALDATTGERVATFGDGGEVDLSADIRLRQVKGYVNYSITSPPALVNDLLVIGSAIGDNSAIDLEKGVVRAYDVRTGEMRWAWDPVPRSPEDPGYDQWTPEAADKTGAANAWSIISADAERDLVFVPTGSASPDYYGGERPGDNPYANSVVALRASTGEVVWYFQVVHHDLWDFDVPAQPVLIDIEKDGEMIPAVVQATKMGHVFFLHRETGEPIHPVEERPVPASDVPGEMASMTQPFPVKPPALVPNTLAPDDGWGLTPLGKRAARERIAALRNDGLFTPPSVQGSIHYPGVAGGTNWGSLAYDAERRLVVMNTTRAAFVVTLIPRDEMDTVDERFPDAEIASMEGTPFGMTREPMLSALGLPQNPPPWGTLAAVDVDTAEIVWESVLGTVRDLAPIPLSIKWGTPSMGGPIITAGGLVFIAATMDNYLRAFDVETGEELWKGRLPAGGQATPMTYRLRPDSKQYVVIVAGGHGKMGTDLGDYVIAWALPE